ncbi:MAG TPA: hypothetical protein RMH99_28945 [Sandaracinaceae bacterium LLY-WYZ-13_1]|nr:hypothetical protein [Sandaracinaceae bacterium LLY-WYZ-13_1]
MLRFALACTLAVALAGCDGALEPLDAGTDDSGPGTDAGPPRCAPEPEGDPRAVFVAPRDGDDEAFFDLPWPHDVRRTAEGTVDVSAFPNPRSNTFVRRYLDAMTARLDGYATNGAVYFRFSHEVDPASLPAGASASLGEGASAFLIDVDPDSPDRGSRHAVRVHYQDCETRYWAPHTVAMRPVYGDPLASDRTYAAVITRGVVPADGGTFGRDADFDALVAGGGDDAVAAARAATGDALDVIADAGTPRDEVIAVTVFTTQDAIGETLAIRDWMVDEYPMPDVTSLAVDRVAPALEQVSGTYGPSPIFQEGELPYAETGGAIEVDEDGVPTVHGEFDARFTLTIPVSPMPEGGYPIVLYAHGTSGDYRTFVRNDVGSLLARQGYAAMGVDQIHHGARNPSETDPSILFFNIPNPDAARDNNRQSALDVVQQARLVPNLEIPVDVLDREGEPIRFDGSRVYFMGHSQGGLNGPLYLAIDDSARGAFLSAASAVITPSLIEKVEPLVIPQIVKALLGLPGGAWEEAFELEGFTVEHPIATLLQTWLEASDGSNYAHLIFESPREGFAPKSVLMTEGLMDRYSPPTSIEALAGSMFVPQVEPVHAPLEALTLRGTAPLAPPVTANVAGGLATAGLLQFPDQGHFAAFGDADAEAQWTGFFASFEEGGPGVIPAP